MRLCGGLLIHSKRRRCLISPASSCPKPFPRSSCSSWLFVWREVFVNPQTTLQRCQDCLFVFPSSRDKQDEKAFIISLFFVMSRWVLGPRKVLRSVASIRSLIFHYREEISSVSSRNQKRCRNSLPSVVEPHQRHHLGGWHFVTSIFGLYLCCCDDVKSGSDALGFAPNVFLFALTSSCASE
jgi:hypothetical protein